MMAKLRMCERSIGMGLVSYFSICALDEYSEPFLTTKDTKEHKGRPAQYRLQVVVPNEQFLCVPSCPSWFASSCRRCCATLTRHLCCIVTSPWRLHASICRHYIVD